MPLKKIIEKAATRSGLFVLPMTKKLIYAAICAAFGAVGPLTPTRHPPKNPPTIPPAIAPHTPAIGPSCEISPNARASGRAIIPTVIPATISPLTFSDKEAILARGLISFKIVFIYEMALIRRCLSSNLTWFNSRLDYPNTIEYFLVRKVNDISMPNNKEKSKKNLFIAGVGLIGSSLIQLIEKNDSFKICGLMNSKKMMIDLKGIDCKNWKTKLNNSLDADFDFFMNQFSNISKSIFVDVTASKKISMKISEILAKGTSVVTASKIANSSNQKYYDDIRLSETIGKVQFKYETNVGAGLPIIGTLKTLLSTNDKILKIEGVLSGTLSYLFSEYDGSIPFSKLIKIAMKSGFTEPDPRNDLNGSDVARKILILVRETGAKIDVQDVLVDSLIDQNIDSKISVNEFLNELEKYDNDFLKVYNKAKNNGKVLRYIAEWDGKKAKVGLKAVSKENQFYYQNGRENFISITTKRYNKSPMVIKGHGAGAEVTAAGILGDILKC